MKSSSTGLWLDFRRVASRRVSGNIWSLLLELVWQPFVVALLVFVAYLHRDDVDPYRLNFIYFSTLYAFWIGLFGACQAINSEVKSGEWCYWVLGLGRNRTVHVLAIFASCLLFAVIQCLVFLLAVVAISCAVDAPLKHFVDMFVSIQSSVDPIYQMNGALWYVLSARWGALGPAAFATGIFGLALMAALVTGTSFGLLFGAFFREPVTSLNMAVGFVVLLGMVSLCGLKGDGNEKIDALFAPLRDWETVYDATKNSEHFASNAIPAAAFSCILPQRYFFNIGRVTFEKDWSNDGNVQRRLRDRVAYNLDSTGVGTDRSSSIESNAVLRYNAYWATDNGRFIPETKCNIAKWIKGWGCGYPTESEQKCYFAKWEEEELKPFEVVNFLRHHPEHRKGWKVAAHRKHLLLTLGMETLPLILLNVLCIAGTLLAVWKKPCYQQLR